MHTASILPTRIGVSAAIVRNDAILMIAFSDESGYHFNLPGGGVEPGESLREAVRREVREEACADVDVGRLLLVGEYIPSLHGNTYGPVPALRLIFECFLCDGSEPHFPASPDPDQIDVCWVPLDQFATAPLIPTMAERLIEMLRTAGMRDPFLSPD